MKRPLLFFGLLLAVVAAFFGLRAWNAKMPEASGNDPVATIQAEDLFNAFQDDEVKAGAQYNDKLIAVTGTVRESNTNAEGRLTLQLEAGAVFGTVVCEFPGPVDAPADGSTVTIKGYCAGFNFDVLLQRCAFAEPTKAK
jgi:hypothetical protein